MTGTSADSRGRIGYPPTRGWTQLSVRPFQLATNGPGDGERNTRGMRPTGVDRDSRRVTKVKVHLIRPHRTQTVARTGRDCLCSEGRTRPWASMEQELAYAGNHISQQEVGPSGRRGSIDCDDPAAAGSVDSL